MRKRDEQGWPSDVTVLGDAQLEKRLTGGRDAAGRGGGGRRQPVPGSHLWSFPVA